MAEIFQSLCQDFRFAVRQLSKTPGFTLTAVAVFALGIAASTAVFAFVDAALVKPLPYRDPSRLVALYERIPVGDRYHLSDFDYLEWKRLNRSLSSLDAYRPDSFALTSVTTPEAVSGARVSDGFFRTLGVVPFLGRDFRPGEDEKSAQPVAILSYETWQKRFAASKSVLGQPVTLDGVPLVVVGVLPRGFHFAPVEPAEFWTTLHGFCSDMPHDCHALYGVGRLKEGVSAAAAGRDLASIAEQIAAQYPHSNRDRSALVIPLVDAILGDVRPTLIALLAGSGLLSLIGFVNVSSLLLVRAEGRRREIAVREALGAGRARLVLQFAVEGFLLAASGCCIGLLLAWCAIRILPGLIPAALLENMPYLEGLHFNLHLLVFAWSVSIFGGLLFSTGPSLQLWVSDMQDGLMEGGRTAVGRSWRRVGASLVVVELAITVVLLVSAGLLAKSFYRLLHEDIGISADHLAVLHVSRTGSPTDPERIALERQVIARMSALPGVTSVGVSSQLAAAGGEAYVAFFEYFRVVGRPYFGVGDEATVRSASVGYLETLRARLLEGRYFTESDDASKPNVGIINRTMARQTFPGEDPLGKQLIGIFAGEHPLEIIGVVDDIKEGPLDTKPIPGVYQPFNQDPWTDFYVTVRTTRSAASTLPSMVHAIHQIDRGLIADEEETMSDRINNSQSAYLHRSASWLVAAFAALALLLGTVGLYGVISYSVGRRTREIGVRMALGAQRRSVYQLILKEACWLAAAGITTGILGSVAAATVLRSMLFRVRPWDTETLLSVVLVLVVAALLASYLPARRAASISPTEALRAE
jgi:macrolide transport system ATP-binding/permease protein